MDFSRARSHLESNGCTLVLDNGEALIESKARGVSPLLSLLEEGKDVSSFCAVDRVVGKAAAFLYILLGIRNLLALTVSESALRLLLDNGICVQYDLCVPRIRNREGTGYCPLESAVLEEKDPQAALLSIRGTLARLRNSSPT